MIEEDCTSIAQVWKYRIQGIINLVAHDGMNSCPRSITNATPNKKLIPLEKQYEHNEGNEFTECNKATCIL